MGEVFKQGPIELRCGRWQDVLADIESCDAVITDPPYGARTHEGQRHGRYTHSTTGRLMSKDGLGYASMGASDVRAFVAGIGARCAGWFCAMTSHDLIPHWYKSLEKLGRYVFAPLAIVQNGVNVRLAGDGPSSWAVWMVVARPRRPPFSKWGTLRGAYVGQQFDPGENVSTRKDRALGGKPLWLMRAIIRDYTRPGDLVVDPCAGGATTLIAAAIEGRRSIGAEMDPETFAKAVARIKRGWTPDLFAGAGA